MNPCLPKKTNYNGEPLFLNKRLLLAGFSQFLASMARLSLFYFLLSARELSRARQARTSLLVSPSLKTKISSLL